MKKWVRAKPGKRWKTKTHRYKCSCCHPEGDEKALLARKERRLAREALKGKGNAS